MNICYNKLEEKYSYLTFNPNKKNNSKIQINFSSQEYSRFRDAAEKAKIQLSSLNTAVVNIPYFIQIPQENSTDKELINLKIEITREEFENHLETQTLVEKIKKIVFQAIQDADINYDKIDEIVFVGGATRMPIISSKISTWFNKKINKSINPDEAVAIGAAIQAAMLSGEKDKDILLMDVTPLSLGIETLGEVMTVMIKRNTTIPVEYRDIFTTSEDNQDNVLIRAYQGERPSVKNNIFLGEFKLDNIIAAPRGIPQIEVVFKIDANGILSVSAKDKITDQEKNIIISGKSSLTKEEIEKTLLEAEQNKEEDMSFQQVSDAKHELYEKLIQIDTILRDMDNELNVAQKTKLEKLKRKINLVLEKSINIDELVELKESSTATIKNISSIIYKLADKLFEQEN